MSIGLQFLGELTCLVKLCIPKYSITLRPYLVFQCVSFALTGGRLVYLYTKKRGSVPKCGDCKNKLQGVSGDICVEFLVKYQQSFLQRNHCSSSQQAQIKVLLWYV